MLINQSTLGSLNTQFDMAFNRGWTMADPMWMEIATEIRSMSSANQYNLLGVWPAIRKWVGDRFINKLKAHGYTLENEDYETTVEVGVNDVEDDQYGLYGPMFESYGRAAAYHPDQLMSELIAAATSTECYDGQYFFDTDHPVNGTTVSNYTAGAEDMWILADLSQPLKPFIYQLRKQFQLIQLNQPNDANVFMDNKIIYGAHGRMKAGFGMWQQAFASKAELTTANYNTVFQAMQEQVDDSGRNLGVTPTHLIVGPSNRYKANQICLADKDEYGATNTNQNSAKPLLLRWLSA